MSAPDQEAPPMGSETELAAREDVEFAVVQARARARARGERYDPARHGPFRDKRLPPRPPRDEPPPPDADAILARFNARGPRQLRLLDAESRRKDLH